MVDPSEAEDQSKCKTGPHLATPSEAPRLPNQADGQAAEDEGVDAGATTMPVAGRKEMMTAAPATPDTTGPLPDQPPSTEPESEPAPKLHLDLYNFDSPAAEGSRYVLTSPRSLEACAHCGVKPVELLPRPLSEFAREAPGRSMRVAAGLFEVYERDRSTKLRQCLEERERIVREEKRRILQATVNGNGSLSSSSSVEQHKAAVVSVNSTQPSKTGTVTSGSVPRPNPGASCLSSGETSTSKAGTVPMTKTPVSSLSPTSKPGLASSSTLSSKAGSMSSMSSSSRVAHSAKHSKPSASFSEQTKAHPNGQGPASVALTTRPASIGPPAVVRKTPTAVKSSNTFPRATAKPSSFPRTTTSVTYAMSKVGIHSPVTPSAAPRNGMRGGPFSQHNGHLYPKGRGKSHSLESLQRRMDTMCSSTSTTTTTTTTTCTSSESGNSSSYSWDGPRDHWAKVSSPRARTLATFNSLMGRSLSLGDLSHSPQTTQKVERIVREVKRRGLKAVPERDRKIAALMLARYQEDDIMSQTRYVAHLQWDSEKRLEELRREQEEREKQRAVLQCQRAWQCQVSNRQRRLSQQEQTMAAAKLRQAAESEERWRELAEQQERSRLQRLQQAAREEKQKKALQEQNLKTLEDDRAAVLEQEKLLLTEKLTIAELKRQEKEHQAQEERRGLNRAERRRHAALNSEIARREEEEREEARKAAEEKLSRSLENYGQIVERRGQELKEKGQREGKQILKARQAAERREKQQQQQAEARAKEAEKRAQQAALAAEEKAKEKAKRVVQSRQEKERLQRLNRQRVEEEEEKRRLELLQSIERKLEKSEQIFREKRAVLESARSVAQASFHMRDRVREETNMRTFDKMALEAQLQASLDEK